MKNLNCPNYLISKSQESLKAYNGIDVLILNHFKGDVWHKWDPANWTYPKSPDEALEEQFKINALSYTKLATRFLTHLEKSNGRIGVISSMVTIIPFPGLALYRGCKMALHGFFETLRVELMEQKTKLSISVVILGVIVTEPLKEGMKTFREFRALVKVRARYVYPVDECAISIVQSLTRRDKLIFYPAFLKHARSLYFLFPEYMEWFLQRETAGFLRE